MVQAQRLKLRLRPKLTLLETMLGEAVMMTLILMTKLTLKSLRITLMSQVRVTSIAISLCHHQRVLIHLFKS